MERESFEDEEVAAYLNEHYVSVKVDREERPDVDHIYMTVCQAMTGHGGWPLTIFMTPKQKPFFAGTYFPKESKYGRSGLLDILGKIRHLWQEDRDKLVQAGDQTARAIQNIQLGSGKTEYELSEQTLTLARQHIQETYDAKHGGFGEAPKFPTPHQYLFLLREWKRTGDQALLDIVEHSLTSMHQGGIYDHLGYGFARYSVDERWLVPHFEKMLYENALLAYVYVETFQATHKELYAQVAREIFDYVRRVMTSPEGGFYSAEDADSEGVEGKFYVWTVKEIEHVLGEQEAALLCDVYDVTEKGNFEGVNILNLIDRELASTAQKHGISPEELDNRLADARRRLFDVREKRTHPHKDDKILTSWNGLMMASLAKGSAVLQEPTYLAMAERAADMIEQYLVNENGRLLARYRDDEAQFPGYIDDYAFYIWGLHEMYMASGKLLHLERAERCLRQAIELFWDDRSGGFFFYGHDAETLIARPKETYDGAIPSGNGVMSLNLIRHSRITGNETHTQLTEQLLDVNAERVTRFPGGHSFFLLALQWILGSPSEIVVTQGENKEAYERMLEKARTVYLPFSVIITADDRATEVEHDSLIGVHLDKTIVDGQSAAYICYNFACQQPVIDETQLAEQLERLQ